ncbi:MAG TPA: hypothetical protein VEL76_24845 [Gemmataceae bacterium]|nr:hypothetical protein [Gemmataceae bacterium]
MQTRMAWLTGMAAGGILGVAVLAQGPGQGQPTPIAPVQAPKPQRDPGRLPPLQRQMFFGARRGADWLQRCNRPDGRFGYVSTPALRVRTENDHYLRQVGAALTLARSARYFGDERAAALATQAVLTLLVATAPDDAKNPQYRHTSVPSTAVNRLAAAGLLVRAVHELPTPANDLLDQADQLCNYLRRQQRADGSLTSGDVAGGSPSSDDSEISDFLAAEALHGLIFSHQRRPAPWKIDVLRKAIAYYHPRWRARKTLAVVPGLTAAWTEAYLLTREQTFADAIFEMNDWLCTLQYQRPDPQRPLWLGGFMGWADGKSVPQPPESGSACYAESLAAACRVTRHLGDALRHGRYREALERCLQFLTTLQFTEANTQHFAEWYRAEVVGGFYVSQQDGNLRLDSTCHAVCALLDYLTHVAEP